MKEIKLFEVRDRGTFVPAMAIRVNDDDDPLLGRAGFGLHPLVILIPMSRFPTTANYDARAWGDRTFATAHDYIERTWNTLIDGDVIDVEYILGETAKPKTSEVR